MQQNQNAESVKMFAVFKSDEKFKTKQETYSDKLYSYWGHVIVMATFILNFMYHGFMFNYNFLFLEFGRTFNTTTVEIGLPGAVSLTVYGFSSPVAAFLFSRFGHRKVLLIGVFCFACGNLVSSFLENLTIIACVYGSMIGFAGNVAGFVTGQMIVLCFNVKYVSLTTGIGLSGAAAGIIVGSPLLSWCYSQFGWRIGLRLIAAVFGIVGLFCAYLFCLPPNFRQKCWKKENEDNEGSGAIKRIKWLVRTPMFWSIQIVFFGCTLVIQFLFISVGNYMKTVGISDGRITLTMTLMGIGDLVGRLFVIFTDNICISRTLVYALNSFLGGMLMFCMLIPQSQLATSLLIAGASAPRGIVISLLLPVTIELFGRAKAVEATSISHFVTGLASMVGPLLSDTPFDETGSYNLTILISGIVFVLAGILAIAVEIMRKRNLHYQSEDLDIKPYRIDKQKTMLSDI